MSIDDMTLQKGAIFLIGSMGKIFVFCRIRLKFCSWLYKKRWHTSWKLQFEKTSNKQVIAKMPLTNLYEMNSSLSNACSLSNALWRFVYSLLFPDETYIICINVFSSNQKRGWIRQKMTIFPIGSHCKKRPHLQRHVYTHDVAKVGDFYNMESLCLFVKSNWNFISEYITFDSLHLRFSQK